MYNCNMDRISLIWFKLLSIYLYLWGKGKVYLKSSIIFLVLFFSVYLSADIKTLSNEYVIFSVSDSGTIGTGIKNGKANKSLNALSLKSLPNDDYLNDIGIPFEFFSISMDNVVYANDNSEGYTGGQAYRLDDRVNEKNIDTLLVKQNQKIIATTKNTNKFEVIHKYSLKEKEIIINTSVKNISNSEARFIYSRGIDMDPPNKDTKNSKGYKDKIGKNELIYTSEVNGNYPLALFSVKNENIPHRTEIMYFNDDGCRYDPKKIKTNVFNEDPIDAVIYMVFDLGSLMPNELKDFNLSYLLDDDLDKLAKGLIKKYYPMKSAIKDHEPIKPIVYKFTPNFEPVGTSHFIIEAESGEHIKVDNRDHNYQLKANNIPKGIQIRFGGKDLTASNKSITIPFKYGEKITYTVFRNKDFKEKNPKTIKLTLDKNGDAENNKIEIEIKPKPRKLTFKIGAGSTLSDVVKINLSDLENSDPIPIKVYAGDTELTPDEYEALKFDVIDVDGIDGGKSGIGIKLELDSLTDLGLVPMYCLTKTGEDLEVTVDGQSGIYTNEVGKGKLYVHIVEDMTWWEQCRMLISIILGILFLLWYLFGLYTKDRFCRSQTIDKYKVDDDGDRIRILPPIKFKKKVNWWQELVPYKREWMYFEGMKFMAGTNCGSVYLSKKTQADLLVDGFEFDDPGKRDERIFHNNMISRTNEEFNIK